MPASRAKTFWNDRRQRHRFVGPCFGRADDLDYLNTRVQSCGLTALVARARSGKSRTLGELESRLADPDQTDSRDFIVGYATAPNPDVLLRAVADAYAVWFATATNRQQGKQLLKRLKQRWASVAAKAGEAGSNLLRLVDPTVATSMAFQQIFRAINHATSGGIELGKPIPFEQARQHLDLLHKFSGDARIVLVLDGFEQLKRNAPPELDVLRSFLADTLLWPHTHILLACRDPETEPVAEDRLVLDRVREFAQQHAAHAAVRRLGVDDHNRLDLAGDAAVRGEVIEHVRRLLDDAALEGVTDDEIITIIDGHPGVLGEWQSRTPQTPDEVRTSARDAIQLRFEEVGRHVNALLADPAAAAAAQVACELALLPEITDPDQWSAYRPVLAAGLNPGLASPADEPTNTDLRAVDNHLNALMARGLLEQTQPFPSFGHTTRYECARAHWLTENLSLDRALQRAQRLIECLASRIRDVDEKAYPYTAALVALARLDEALGLPPAHRTLCRAAESLLPGLQPDTTPAEFREAAETAPECAPLVSMALVNALHAAALSGDAARVEALLGELRRLHESFPDDAAVRERLAKGLFNALHDATLPDDAARVEALLGELRGLHESFPDDVDVREWLAKGLFNTLHDAASSGDAAHASALLVELRGLHESFPDDVDVRELMAKGLFNALNAAASSGDAARAKALIVELRGMHQSSPDDAAVREQLAKGLFNALHDAASSGDGAGAEAMLVELRGLHESFPDDAAVRERLAKGLGLTLERGMDAAATCEVLTPLAAELKPLVSELEDADLVRTIQATLAKFRTRCPDA